MVWRAPGSFTRRVVFAGSWLASSSTTGNGQNRVVLTREDQHGTPDGAGHGPEIEAAGPLTGVVQVHVHVLDHPGQELAGFPGPAGRGAVQRVADPAELSLVIPGLIGVGAPRDVGRLGAAEAAERLDDALLVAAAPGGVGQDDPAGVIGEQPRVAERDVPAEAAAEHYRLVQPERVAQPPQVIGQVRLIPESALL